MIRPPSFVHASGVMARFVDPQAHLMIDQNWAYQQIGKDYAAHSWVNHSAKEFARGDVHNNTAESFNSLLERAKQGIFHYVSLKHLPRSLNKIGFRWAQRTPTEIVTKHRRRKTVMVALSVMNMLCTLLTHALGRQLRRTRMAEFESQLQNLAEPSSLFFRS